MIRILLADDHQILLDGIQAILDDDPELSVVGTASNGLEALSFLENNKVDVLLLDLQMPKMDGMETIEQVHKLYPEVKILMLSMHKEEAYIRRSIENGANGYLVKDTDSEHFLIAIRTVFSGQKYFGETCFFIFITKIEENLVSYL